MDFVAGDHLWSMDPPYERRVKALEIYKHPKYPGSNGHSYDICLVKVEPMDLNGIERDIVCLPKANKMPKPRNVILCRKCNYFFRIYKNIKV